MAKTKKKPSQWSKPLTISCEAMPPNKAFPYGGVVLDIQRGYQRLAFQMGGFAPAAEANVLAELRRGIELFKVMYGEAEKPPAKKKKGKN